MKPTRVAAALLLALLTGCGTPAQPIPADAPETPSVSVTPDVTAEETPDVASEETPDAQAGQGEAPGTAGLAPGIIPPVPLFTLPDVSVVDGAGASLFDGLKKELPKVPGVRVKPVACGKDGSYVSTEQGTAFYDGTMYTGPDGTVIKSGDSDFVSTPGETYIRTGESYTYSGYGVTITRTPNGGGTYSGGDVTVTLNGSGAGTRSGQDGTITNNGNGSGTFSGDGVTITNNGNGAGTYSGPDLTITNDGKGQALVTSSAGMWTVKADPLPPVPKLGKFPPAAALRPLPKVCGYVITLEDGVLFDFDKSDLRPDAAATVDKVAGAIKTIGGRDLAISGHTDAIGTDAYNMDLSKRRAQTVEDALRERGITAPMTSTGYGESKPVAPNEINGKDNPAGRQLNRRVEIFVRA